MPLKLSLLRAALFLLIFFGGARYRGLAAELRTYTSPNGVYTVEYPSTWHHFPEARSLYIVNFPLDHMVREILLPRNGALISVARMRPKPRSLEEWIARDTQLRTVVQSRTFEVRRRAGAALSVTELLSRSARGRYKFEERGWYFSVDGRLFEFVLLYHQSDPLKDHYVEVLKEVLASLRVNR
jgi:hypothetical protein